MASILAVDDSISMRQMLCITLERDGHHVTATEDGLIALNIARENSFDLVITDLQMPNLDGISLIRELRKLSDFKRTPLFILSTESADDRKQAGRLAGATGWIVKPINPDQLRQVIRLALAGNLHIDSY
jgi:two-component system chemotaxis response regulator CheY